MKVGKNQGPSGLPFCHFGFCAVRCDSSGTTFAHVQVCTRVKGIWKQRQFFQSPVGLQLILCDDNMSWVGEVHLGIGT